MLLTTVLEAFVRTAGGSRRAFTTTQGCCCCCMGSLGASESAEWWRLGGTMHRCQSCFPTLMSSTNLHCTLPALFFKLMYLLSGSVQGWWAAHPDPPRPAPCLTLVVLSTTDSLLATATGKKWSIWGYLTARSLCKAQEGSQDGVCLVWGPSSRAVGSVCVPGPAGVNAGCFPSMKPVMRPWEAPACGCRSGWQCCSHLHVFYLWLSLNFQSLLRTQ